MAEGGLVTDDVGRAAGVTRIDLLTVVEKYAILIIWAMAVIFFSIARPDTFFQTSNFENIFNSRSVLIWLVLGLLFSLAAGEFDLSVGAALSAGAAVPVWLSSDHGWNILLAIAAALVLAGVLGAINAVVTVRIGVPSIVTTLGSGALAFGLLEWRIGNTTQTLGKTGWVDVMRAKPLLGLNVGFWITLAACIITWYVFQHTPVGRRLYFVGQGREVARLSGIPVARYRALSLIVGSVLAAFAGAVLIGNTGSAQINVGAGRLLPALAAAFLGSTQIVPGKFNLWGAWAATYFLATGITGLQLMGYIGWVDEVFFGASLLVAVVIAALASRLRAR